MARTGVQVQRLDQIAPGKVDAIKLLTEFDKILASFGLSGHFCIQLYVAIIGRQRNMAKKNIAAANDQFPLRVARRYRPLVARFGHHSHHKMPVHLHVRAT